MLDMDLKTAIFRAFDDTVASGQSVIAVGGDNVERRRLAKIWNSKSWKEIEIDFLMENYDAISFFSDSGFVYYLPAYMVLSIECEGDSIIPYTTCLHLIPRSPGKGLRTIEDMHRIYDCFTLEQRDVIRDFLEYIESAGSFVEITATFAKIALRVFWGKPERE